MPLLILACNSPSLAGLDLATPADRRIDGDLTIRPLCATISEPTRIPNMEIPSQLALFCGAICIVQEFMRLPTYGMVLSVVFVLALCWLSR